MVLQEILLKSMRELVLLKPIKIKSSINNYKILFETDDKIFNFENDHQYFYIIDSNVKNIYYKNIFCKNIINIDANEKNKTFSTVSRLIEKLRSLGANKKSTLIVIGGGITQDVCTMVASIFMRGINWILIPTTLLSMVDSCIGGKSSINVNRFKNLAGNYYPPNKILIFVKYCSSLGKLKIIEGLCEALKIIYASNPDNFKKNLASFNFQKIEDLKNLQNITYTSLLKKKKYVEEDEFDENERLLLNFGHTFGHAIESASKYQVPHGVAIGLGMILAINCSENRHIQNIRILETYLTFLLRQWGDIKNIVKKINQKSLINSFENDKKHLSDFYRLILPNSLNGKLNIINLEKNVYSTSKINNTFKVLRNLDDCLR